MIRRPFLSSACALLLLLTAVASASAQNEAALRTFFEGKRVSLKIDMPATSEGVDLRLDTPAPLDYRVYGGRIAQAGKAIVAGESSIVTAIRLKKDLIEFQLGGGGFGYESSSVFVQDVEKSNREIDLEKQVKTETDPGLKRSMERELADLQTERERQNARIALERARAEEEKKARIDVERLKAGSRFNLRYAKAVPPSITPNDVMAALASYVDFDAGSASTLTPAPLPTPLPTAAPGSLRKGMLRADVVGQLGTPVQAADRKEGTLTVTTLVFIQGEQRIAADFVEDVLFHYSISSN
jgi:hypothetical protein